MKPTLIPTHDLCLMFKAHHKTILDALHKAHIEPEMTREGTHRTVRYFNRDQILNAAPAINEALKKMREEAREIQREAAVRAAAKGRASMAEMRAQATAASDENPQPERVMRLMTRLDRIEAKLDRLMAVWGITYG